MKKQISNISHPLAHLQIHGFTLHDLNNARKNQEFVNQATTKKTSDMSHSRRMCEGPIVRSSKRPTKYFLVDLRCCVQFSHFSKCFKRNQATMRKALLSMEDGGELAQIKMK